MGQQSVKLYNILVHIAVAQLVGATRYKPEGRGFEPLLFFIDIILPVAL
jgi:hypothetical protein